MIIATQSIHKLYRALRLEMKGMSGSDEDLPALKLINKSGFDPKQPIECDVVKSGNAWLLTDGRGRKAKMDDKTECHLVAQLLYVQELQSGRTSKLLQV